MNRYEPSDVEKAEQHRTLPISSPPPSSPFHPSPDPPATDAAAAATANCRMHPVMEIMKEKELGKFLLASAIAILGIVVAGRDSLGRSETGLVLLLVSFGFTAIFYGILLKDTFPRFSDIVEAVGIVLIAVSFFSIIAFFMPVEFSWAPALCIVLLCLLPLFVLFWPSATG